jgi:site-specific DNA-methyltransferase (adenine-specific)
MINKVYLDDCMNIMKNFKYNNVLAIVDPEYGLNEDDDKTIYSKAGKGMTFKRKEKKFKKKNWDNKIPDKKYFDELFRISKNQIIWGGNYFTKYLNPTKAWVFWYKKITNKNEKNHSDGELAWTSFNKITKFVAIDWIGFGYINSGEKKIHTSQKPVALYKWLLQNYAKSGDLIFDSHVGSGSLRIACYELGFDFIGVELDEDYWEAQEKRFMEFKKKFHNEFYIGEENDLFKGVK